MRGGLNSEENPLEIRENYKKIWTGEMGNVHQKVASHQKLIPRPHYIKTCQCYIHSIP